MKEKNELESFDVGDFVNGLSGFERNGQRPIQRDEVPTKPSVQSVNTETIESTPPNVPTAPTESTEPLRRTSSKQRKASLDEYREQFLKAPKITDRQPVFVSRSTRDRIDDIVRRLGERRMSVSGFLENLANQHLETYSEDVEQWKRL